ncbi:TetR/AcrR family transcriptional regulator C-terminal domain-containing protein [Corallococcus exiguus]|uniref:TetR/AcrR family transcriptional regulator n=1 Tax=Corallococcus exiguus TaxID=83462 RepID=UPI001A8C4D2D|nr:TetR/AcrR family transcriptional regulator C-terminal domain-containing protein [Corallococcus exiguus]MBN8471191.1 TetR/AcrR family transcriptional regulator C-terminal domain-containing protein [Corallococcus exiguus]
MSLRLLPPAKKVPLLWERPEPAPPPGSVPLRWAAIARAAVSLADKKGLGAVTLRTVAAALKVDSKRLRERVFSKEELHELMVDAFYQELLADSLYGGDWRQILREVAQQSRRAVHKHLWFTDLQGPRFSMVPHALVYIDTTLDALADEPGFENIGSALRILQNVSAYATGAIVGEATEVRCERRFGKEWMEMRDTLGPYYRRRLATGRFARIVQAVEDPLGTSLDVLFDQGLEFMIDGIAARLSH